MTDDFGQAAEAIEREIRRGGSVEQVWQALLNRWPTVSDAEATLCIQLAIARLRGAPVRKFIGAGDRGFISVEAFRAKLRARQDTGGARLMALYVSKQPEQIRERTLRWVLSDGTVDRADDVIRPDGWVLGNYRRNNVVLWAHRSDMPPIGKANNVSVINRRLVGDIEFMPPDVSSFADQIYRMAKDGWIKAGSVGFLPLDARLLPSGGIEFRKQELLEFSICPVPANANALSEAKSLRQRANSPQSPLPARIAEAQEIAASVRTPAERRAVEARGIAVAVRCLTQMSDFVEREVAAALRHRAKIVRSWQHA